MALYIYLEHRDQASWVRLDKDGQVLETGQGTLADIARSGERATVFVPGEEVLLCAAHVPGLKRRLQAQAVPYALEDQLVGDVEAQHFSLGQIHGDSVDVAVVSHAQMQVWLARLHDAEIDPAQMIADVQALPLPEKGWSLYQFGGRCLLRCSPQGGVVQEADNAPLMLQAALQDCSGDAPEYVQYVYSGDCPLEISIEGLEIRRTPLSVLPVVALAQAQHQDNTSINLMQGPYSRREQISKYWRPWRVAAALLAAVLVLQFVLVLVDQQRLAAEKRQLKADIEQIYRDAFPKARKVVNARVQMERALKAMKGGGDGDRDAFTRLLARAGQAFKASPKLTLERISYRNGLLDVSLVVGDLQQLDRLKQRLMDESGLAVEIHSATSKAGRVEARLRIKEAS